MTPAPATPAIAGPRTVPANDDQRAREGRIAWLREEHDRLERLRTQSVALEAFCEARRREHEEKVRTYDLDIERLELEIEARS